MTKADKQRLIDAVLGKNPNCTECGKLINNYQFEYEPKFMPLDAPVVCKRADNGRKWVMCKGCSDNQEILRIETKRNEAKILVEKNSIDKPISVKTMTSDEIKKHLQKQNLAVNILLGQYGVPQDQIKIVKTTMRSEFHINYYLKHGKFLTEKDESNIDTHCQ